MINPVKDKKYPPRTDRGGDFEYYAPNSTVKMRQGTEGYVERMFLGFRVVRNK